MRTKNRYAYIVTAVVAIILVAGAAVVGQDTLVTTTGRELSGTVSGIDTVVRLDIVPAAGPMAVFTVPRSAIHQITVDFPRVIVETANRVYIGPFSDFTGIEQMVDVQHGGSDTAVPFAGVRAIALNGYAIHPVPREWLGDRFLTGPTIAIAPSSATTASTTTTAAAPPATAAAEQPINWAKINPSPSIPPEESTGTPWWIGVIIAAVAAGLLYFSLSAAK